MADADNDDTCVAQIVFFEMNHAFSTGSERIAVLEGLRKPDISFPKTWDPRRTRQQQSKWFER